MKSRTLGECEALIGRRHTSASTNTAGDCLRLFAGIAALCFAPAESQADTFQSLSAGMEDRMTFTSWFLRRSLAHVQIATNAATLTMFLQTID